MYLLLIVLFEYIVFIHLLHLYVTIFIGLIYALWYFDGKEYTGERRWDAFRQLRIWTWLTPVQYVFPHRADMTQTMCKRLFVFPTALTPSSLIWGIGLHGGQLTMNQPLHYIVPPVYMWIPFLRDVLMWTGAVTYSLHNTELNSKTRVIESLLEHGRAVAYSPSNFFNHLYVDDLEASIEHRYPTDDVLNYCIRQSVTLIPVIVNHEHERYRIVLHPKIQTLQRRLYAYLEYPLPFCYWYRLFNRKRPPKIVLNIGHAMSCNLYADSSSNNNNNNSSGQIERLKSVLKDTVSSSVTMAPPLQQKHVKSDGTSDNSKHV